MKLFIKDRVLKSCSVEIVSPKVVECHMDFSELSFQPLAPTCAEVVTDNNEEPNEEALKAREEADKIVQEARQRAEEMLVEAEEKAKDILFEAEEQGAEIRQRIVDEIRQEIIPEVRAEAILAFEKETAEVRLQAKRYLELANKALEDECIRAEKDIVELALKIAERIIRTSVKLHPAIIADIMRKNAFLCMEKENIRIHVSLNDHIWLSNLPEEQRLPYPFIADETLSSGDLYIESDEGAFDLRITSQLEKLENALMGELADDKLGGHGEYN